ncbi:MAG: hypothetical protein JST88_09240 [Bacteroidetes bacterium]|nr:hypothetical protein [Bacteroidota bacterium]
MSLGFNYKGKNVPVVHKGKKEEFSDYPGAGGNSVSVEDAERILLSAGMSRLWEVVLAYAKGQKDYYAESEAERDERLLRTIAQIRLRYFTKL